MSEAPCEINPMKKQTGYCPVILEPELEQETALFTPAQRLALAQKFRRWARQLDVSAFIMLRNQHSAGGSKSLSRVKSIFARALWKN